MCIINIFLDNSNNTQHLAICKDQTLRSDYDILLNTLIHLNVIKTLFPVSIECAIFKNILVLLIHDKVEILTQYWNTI